MNSWKNDLVVGMTLVLLVAFIGSCGQYGDNSARKHKETMLELKIEAKKVGL